MKTRTVIALTIVGSFAVLCAGQDLSGILMDRHYVGRQISCILDQGPCDPVGRQIRGLLPEVVNNNCRRCTPYQVRNARKLIDFMQLRYPHEWQLILQRYTAMGYYIRNPY